VLHSTIRCLGAGKGGSVLVACSKSKRLVFQLGPLLQCNVIAYSDLDKLGVMDRVKTRYMYGWFGFIGQALSIAIQAEQLAAFVFLSPHLTPERLQSTRQALHRYQMLGLSEIRFEHQFGLSLLAVASLSINIYLVQECVQWRKLTAPSGKQREAWGFVLMGLGAYCNFVASAMLIPVVSTLLRTTVRSPADSSVMEANMDVPYLSPKHVVVYLVPSAVAATVMVLLVPRLHRAEYNLSRIQGRANPLDWTGDGCATDGNRPITNPLTFESVRGHNIIFGVKLALLVLRYIAADVTSASSASELDQEQEYGPNDFVLVSCQVLCGAVLLATDFRYNRFVELPATCVDPNSILAGLDAGILSLYICMLLSVASLLEAAPFLPMLFVPVAIAAGYFARWRAASRWRSAPGFHGYQYQPLLP